MPEKVNHNPDILSCLANLSSDEVFTPPEVANAMLDMLPQELFQSPDTKFLDPGCKSGVFLREIAKRLNDGLVDQFPNVEQRLDHIMKKQLFAIAITQITGLISRRSVYCTKDASSIYSVARFDGSDGNIRFRRIEHQWDGIGKKDEQKCVLCGASRKQFDRGDGMETHAYEFIHMNKTTEKEFKEMRFDVIIGNPPYQLEDGGNNASATPLYDKFVEQAKKLCPRYLSMIIPARWFSGGRGLDDFRKNMLNDSRIRKIVDYPISAECFAGVEIKGGVCYFLWERESKGDCTVSTVRNGNTTSSVRPLLEEGSDVFIRWNEAVSIYHKVASRKEVSFSALVSTQRPFGLRTYVLGTDKPGKNPVQIFANKRVGYVEKNEITMNKDWIPLWKIYISAGYGAGEDFPHQILGKPILGCPNTCCSETYLAIGPFENKAIAENVLSYISCKFFRMMVLLQKSTQHTSKKVYSFVPMQDFSKPWTDEELYEKYRLTEEEISFIDSMIRPMNLGGTDD